MQQTRILRLRLFNCVASVLLVIFNAAVAVWSMVALNIALTAINGFYIVQLLRGRHDSRSFEVVKVTPTRGRSAAPLTRLRRRHPALQPLGLSSDAEFGFLILTGAATVGVVLAQDAAGGSAQVELDYVVPKYQGSTIGEFVPRRGVARSPCEGIGE